MDQNARNARGLAIWFALLSTALVFAILPYSKVSFAFADPAGLGYLFAVYFVISIYCWKRQMLRLAPALEGVSLGIFMTVPTLLASYMAASMDLPLTDHALTLADQALGFEWMPFIEFIDAHSLLAHTLAVAYSSFAIQLLALPLLLGAAGRYERVYVMILSYGLICYAACIVSIWFPALGTYVVYGLAPDQLQNINPHYGFAFLADFNAVREQPAFTLSVASASGIITFPSVHAAGAFLCAWAAWDIKPVRYPMAAWNILMAVSAISHANHYLVDIIAGVSLSAVSIFVVTEILRRIRPMTWEVLLPSTVLAMLIRAKPKEDGSPTLT